MALFTSIEEVKRYVAVNASLRLEDILPFIQRAENLHIRPTLTKPLYNELHQAVTDGAELTPEQKQLLELCRDCLANFAFLLFIPHGLTQVNAAGIHQQQNNTKKPATPEQIQKLEASYATTAYKALDELLEFLEENAPAFAAYDLSASRQYLLHSTRQFARFVNIGGSRRTYIALQPIMGRVEQNLIRKILGPDLYRTLKNYAGGDYEPTAEGLSTEALENLLEEVKPLVAYKTIEKGITELALTITETGLHIYSSSSSLALTLKLPADAQRIENLRLEYKAEAEQAEKSLMDYLYKLADTYTQFKESGAYLEPATAQDLNADTHNFYIA